MADKWNKQKEMEIAKIKMLMDDFDNGIFLDETGDFKYTNPDVKAVIRCDDINHLGNATQNQLHDHLETVHGFNTEDLIEIQNIKLTDDIPERSEIQAVGKSISSNASFNGSQPRSKEQPSRQADAHNEHKHEAKSFIGHGRQPRHPVQQQGIPQAQGLINRPPLLFQAPYWSPTQPPPPLINQFSPASLPLSNQFSSTQPPFSNQSSPASSPLSNQFSSAQPPFSNKFSPTATAFSNQFSPTQPPFNNQFSFAQPHANPRPRYRYPNNGAFQNGREYSRALNPQNYQRRVRPNTQGFHSTNVFKK